MTASYGSTADTNSQPAPKPNYNPAVWALVIKDMADRDAFGYAKYGTRLQPGNGRDFLIDAYQEALDLVVYLRGAIYERDMGILALEPLRQRVVLKDRIAEGCIACGSPAGHGGLQCPRMQPTASSMLDPSVQPIEPASLMQDDSPRMQAIGQNGNGGEHYPPSGKCTCCKGFCLGA